MFSIFSRSATFVICLLALGVSNQALSAKINFTPESVAAKAVISVIENSLEKGFSLSDAALLQTVLTDKFQRRVTTSTTKALVEDRQAFLAALSGLFKGQKLNYDVHSLKISADGNSAAAIAVGTYKSRYFAPQFIETLIFKKVGSDWKLSRQTLLPLHPKSSKSYKVEIFLTQPFWPTDKYDSYAAYFTDQFQKVGPVALMAELEKKYALPGG